MELMTKEIEKELRKHPLYSQEDKGGDAKVIVKYFGGSSATWLITEGKEVGGGDWLLFGLVTLGFHDQLRPGELLWEWGYVMLSELEGIRFPPFGLPAERDAWLRPGRKTVRELAEGTSMFEEMR